METLNLGQLSRGLHLDGKIAIFPICKATPSTTLSLFNCTHFKTKETVKYIKQRITYDFSNKTTIELSCTNSKTF